MALAYLAVKTRKQFGPQLKIADNPLQRWYAYIVDHGLREGSSEEARKVAVYLKEQLKISTEVIKLNWAKELGQPDVNPSELPNIESLARQLRYRRMGKAANHAGITSILTAHHEDDQYETILMRLLSGHGYRGLQGIRRATDIPECYDMHGVYKSGLIDDQFGPNAFYRYAPSHRETYGLKRGLRKQMDPDDLLERWEQPTDLFSFFDQFEENERGRGLPQNAPIMMPIDVEDGGISLYRPLLPFSKERLIATCLENGVPWFEDHTNKDPKLTMRNAVRHVCKNHELPAALQKPAVLELGAKCRVKVAREEAEADRRSSRLRIYRFDRNTGSLIVEMPKFPLPTVPRRAAAFRHRRQRRISHYRLIAALLVRRLISIVGPDRELPAPRDLGPLVSLLFPWLREMGEAQLPFLSETPKPYVIRGVHFIPLAREQPLRWLITRAPHITNAPKPSKKFFAQIPAPLWELRDRPSEWSMGQWLNWQMYDGRFWIRLRHRIPVNLLVAPFEPEHQKRFREALDDDSKEDLAMMLKFYAPGKVRYTLPAIYAVTDVSGLIAEEQDWLVNVGRKAAAAADAAGQPVVEAIPILKREEEPPATAQLQGVDGDKGQADMEGEPGKLTLEQWIERKQFSNVLHKHLPVEPHLLALPTLGIALPGLETFLDWEVRYRQVDLALLERGADAVEEDERKASRLLSRQTGGRPGARAWSGRHRYRKRRRGLVAGVECSVQEDEDGAHDVKRMVGLETQN